MRLYTVHFRRFGPDSAHNLILIKEGFSWPAFFFTGFWALWRGLWLAALGLFGVYLAVSGLALLIGLDPVSRTVVALGFSSVAGFTANDLWRWTLERRDYRFTGVVTGADMEDAERRYLDREPATAAVVFL